MVWGLLHGAALAAESAGLARLLKRAWRPIRHLYTLGIVTAGWVFFRADTLPLAFAFFRRLAGDSYGLTPQPFSQTNPSPFIEPSFIFALTAAVFFSLPVVSAWKRIRAAIENRRENTFIFFRLSKTAFSFCSLR
jgi:alginate O-acetyltransferase complex protein AlgI